MTTDLSTRTAAIELPEGAILHSVGLALPDELKFNDWKRIGQTIASMGDSLQWAIGDWLNRGERYRRDYSAAMHEIDHAYQTMANLKYVASKVEISRRRENLSWSHHAEVASLEPEWQTIWLDDALRQNWNREELRAAIREWKDSDKDPVRSYVKLAMRIDPERFARYETIAAARGMTPVDWAISVLDAACAKEAA